MVFTTMIPTVRNDGSRISRTERDDILRGLWQAFGGCTVENCIGHWISPDTGRHFEERNLKVTVACDADRIDEARQAVLAIGRRLDQEAMYFEVHGFDGVRFLKVG